MRIAVIVPVLALALGFFAGPALAYHASCGGGQVPQGDRCETRNHMMDGNIGGDGFLVCPSANPSQGDIQYDYMVLFGGSSRYVCTHYHTCSEVQTTQPNIYNEYCT